MTEVWRFQPLHHGCRRRKADEQAYQGRSASMLSVVRSVEVPLGISTPGQPNLASTIWRVVSEQQKRVMVDDSVTFPSDFWVSRDQLNLRAGAPVRRLQVAGGQVYAGETATQALP